MAHLGLIGPGLCQCLCLCCWQPNGTSLKENVYMFPNAVRHEVSNSSAMATRNIIDAIPATTSSHMATILTLHQGPTWALVTCVAFKRLWKMCEQFRPIFTCIGHFSLVVVKSSMTSYIHFIVTNMRMWKNMDLLGPCWPFVWGYKSWPFEG